MNSGGALTRSSRGAVAGEDRRCSASVSASGSIPSCSTRARRHSRNWRRASPRAPGRGVGADQQPLRVLVERIEVDERPRRPDRRRMVAAAAVGLGQGSEHVGVQGAQPLAPGRGPVGVALLRQRLAGPDAGPRPPARAIRSGPCGASARVGRASNARRRGCRRSRSDERVGALLGAEPARLPGQVERRRERSRSRSAGRGAPRPAACRARRPRAARPRGPAHRARPAAGARPARRPCAPRGRVDGQAPRRTSNRRGSGTRAAAAGA